MVVDPLHRYSNEAARAIIEKNVQTLGLGVLVHVKIFQRFKV